MKYSAFISLLAAPLAMGKALRNEYAMRERSFLSPSGAPGIAPVINPVVGLGGLTSGTTQVIVIWANPGGEAATTTVNQQVTVTQTVTAGAGAGTPSPIAGGGAAAVPTHSVTVGGNAGLVFTPAEVKANVGDMVVFTFESQNHTATQSGFDTPCDKLDGGMNTGFQPNPDNTVNPPPQVAMQVMTTEPLWFYCAQEGHCGQGMVFSVNPTAEKSQQKFTNNALLTGGNAASPITGGGAAGGGSSSVVPPAASSSVAPPPAASSGSVVVPGAGTVQNGACVCAVTCATSNFPVGVQGVGAFGGFSGSLPARMVETV